MLFQIIMRGRIFDRSVFIVDVASNSSLTVYRRLAYNMEIGYGVLVHGLSYCVVSEVLRVVVPKSWRNTILQLSLIKLYHIGFRKTEDIIMKKFT